MGGALALLAVDAAIATPAIFAAATAGLVAVTASACAIPALGRRRASRPRFIRAEIGQCPVTRQLRGVSPQS